MSEVEAANPPTPADAHGRDRGEIVAAGVMIAVFVVLGLGLWSWMHPDPMDLLELEFGPAREHVVIVEYEQSVVPFVTRVYWKLQLDSDAALVPLTRGMERRSTTKLPAGLAGRRLGWWSSREAAVGEYWFGTEPGHQVDRTLWYDPITHEAFLEWSKG